MKEDKLIRLQVEEGEQEVVVPCKARRLNERHVEWYKDGGFCLKLETFSIILNVLFQFFN